MELLSNAKTRAMADVQITDYIASQHWNLKTLSTLIFIIIIIILVIHQLYMYETLGSSDTNGILKPGVVIQFV